MTIADIGSVDRIRIKATGKRMLARACETPDRFVLVLPRWQTNTEGRNQMRRSAHRLARLGLLEVKCGRLPDGIDCHKRLQMRPTALGILIVRVLEHQLVNSYPIKWRKLKNSFANQVASAA